MTDDPADRPLDLEAIFERSWELHEPVYRLLKDRENKMTDEPIDYRLDRTGKLPLSFAGEHLAGVSGEEFLDERRKNPRWHRLDLYRTQAGAYVLHVQHMTDWKDEVPYDEAMVLSSPKDVVDALLAWEPSTGVQGYPPGEQFQKKQERLLEEVRARFDRCVSELFAQLGPEFSERID